MPHDFDTSSYRSHHWAQPVAGRQARQAQDPLLRTAQRLEGGEWVATDAVLKNPAEIYRK